MEKPNYTTVITTIAVSLLLLFFTTLSAQIMAIESRLRSVEVQITAISTSLGIRAADSTDSQTPSGRAAAGSALGESMAAGSLIPLRAPNER